ncbi:general transcription factor II-I repeat domain-containing protein 2-like [Tachypleus tridentatus]|uniref:general transcription factor II-I repeat domain-containing protein 2-like n=1 Tax=Tachypleus tridentatus TaxID=6853 RepID=UPI003FCFE814
MSALLDSANYDIDNFNEHLDFLDYEDIGSNIVSQLKDRAKEFEYFFIVLDESTDVSDTLQLLLFIRGVNINFEVIEELASVHSLHGTTPGENIFKEFENSLIQYNLEWKPLKFVTTDGGKNMCDVENGLVGQIYKDVESTESSKPMVLHCIIHQQALCTKYLDLPHVMQPALSTVNFIRSWTQPSAIT